ncbi:hypothetical protein K6675_000472 [Vibrio parahaemolyticus]|nr:MULTISPECIES: hypothetical protein [Vibrio harveyi group]EHK2864336.1 hypothetical protein [Vibrio parahaemolyticus]EHK9099301.1 hypothetical protein [Vibrio parahaemolyticus]EIA1329932.1 hypothetical protein [Vibrio parahaemolyticus]EID0730151.1 hypothetical protein [Vibrio parahaemolyticus]EIT7135236.1 hypothetical protein [Vibrio parahaemolyticus]
MSIPLQKVMGNGVVYQRRTDIDSIIDKLEALPSEELVESCLDSENLLPMEVVLYFLRHKATSLPPLQYKKLFLFFVKRIQGSLLKSISNQQFKNAEDLRQEVVDRFMDLLVKDRNEGCLRLDYFEINFNGAFHKLRIDVLRQRGPAKKEDPLSNAESIESELTSEVRTDVEISALELSELNESILNDSSFRIQFQSAINELPDNERRVIGLYLQGLPIESKDVDKETISSTLDCTDRTVRNRLSRAYCMLREKLLLEDEL